MPNENCNVFDAASTRRTLTPWGQAVRTKLLERRMKQEELVPVLEKQGFEADKITISNLLYGYGVNSRREMIQCISEYLGIKYRT